MKQFIDSNDPLLNLEILKNVSEGICLVRLDDNTIVYTNARMEEMFGYGHGEMIGKNVSIMHAPMNKTLEEIKVDNVDVLEKTGEWHGGIENIKKDGTHFWCYVNASLFEYPEIGKVIVSVYMDMTKNKILEAELQSKQRELEAILDFIPAGVAYKNANNQFVKVNTAFAHFMKKSKAELENRSLSDLYTKEDAERYWKVDKRILKTGKPEIGIMQPIEFADGVRWTQTDKIPFTDRDGKVIGVIAFVMDITDKKTAEEQMVKHAEELQNFNRLMVGRELKMVELKKEIERLKRNS